MDTWATLEARDEMSLEDDRPKEECGVVGVFAPGDDVARLTYYALYALQHRGQESAGIAVSEGEMVLVVKEMGLVAQVFDESTLKSLQGHLAIGHVRYSTTGSSRWENAQPVYRESGNLGVALAHNGNLVNTRELAETLQRDPGARSCSTDSDVIAEMIVRTGKPSVEEAILEVLPKLKGAFSLTMMDEGKVFGARDPYGVRPLVLGKVSNGYVIASETCALAQMGAEFIREVEPGELVVIDEKGLRSHRFAEATPKLCIFEFVYVSREDSVMYGKSVQKARYRMGIRLAREAPVSADLVIPVPNSGRGAAQGYAAESGIAYGEGLVVNSYVGRTFIKPTQSMRDQGIRTKLNPINAMIEGKRLVVVEDSIVRGSTTRQVVRMLREAGAKEVHMRISSPPIKWPCFYGMDFPTHDELIGAWKSVAEIGEQIEADSLDYLSLEGMIESTDVDEDKFCHACFSGKYPISIPTDVKVTKNMLEEAPAEARVRPVG